MSKSPALKVSAAAYENVRLQKWVNTEFVWEFKRGFVKGVVRAKLSAHESVR